MLRPSWNYLEATSLGAFISNKVRELEMHIFLKFLFYLWFTYKKFLHCGFFSPLQFNMFTSLQHLNRIAIVALGSYFSLRHSTDLISEWLRTQGEVFPRRWELNSPCWFIREWSKHTTATIVKKCCTVVLVWQCSAWSALYEKELISIHVLK